MTATKPPNAPGAAGGTTYRIGGDPLLAQWGNPDLSGSSAGDVYTKLVQNLGLQKMQKLYSNLTGQNLPMGATQSDWEKLINAGGAAANGVYGFLQSNGFLGSYDVTNPPAAKKSSSSSSGGSASGGSATVNYYGGTASTTDMSALSQASAYNAFVDNYLHPWGLDALAPQAWSYVSDPGNHMDEAGLIQWIRSTPQYAARFPGLAARTANGYPAMSESQYMTEEAAIQEAAGNYGLPAGFMSTQEVGNLIANNISSAEVTDRIKNGYEMAMNAPPEVKTLLQDYYGVDTGNLAAYYLDPTKATTLILKQTQGALIGNEAIASGFGNINVDTANQLAQQAVASPNSMDLNYFRQGFAKVAPLKPLEQQQVGQRGQATVDDRQLLSTAFSGMNQPMGTSPAGDQAAIRQASEARVAGLQGGGGYVANAKGVEGAGSASTAGRVGT